MQAQVAHTATDVQHYNGHHLWYKQIVSVW